MASDAPRFSQDELQEALRAIASTIGKCEKVAPKLRPGTSQHTLLSRRLKALRIASALIERELGGVANDGVPARSRAARTPARPRAGRG